MTENGVTANQALKASWTMDVFSNKATFETIELVTTKLAGDPSFLTVYKFVSPEFYYYGNFSKGELSDGMVASGICPNVVANTWCVDNTPLQDGSTYVIVVIDSLTKTAIGGVLEYLPISVYGNGSTNDTTGTQSELESSQVYIATADPDSVSFDNGYETGYVPMVNATAGAIFQYLPDGSYAWEITAENIHNPEAMQIRYFTDLAFQPVVVDLIPDKPFPIPPKTLPKEATLSGNITTQQLVDGLYAQTGLNWNGVNFNNTPSAFLLSITNTDNQTILGFIYDAFSAPPPPPVIKGGNGNVELQNNFSDTPYIAAAWLSFLFMLFNFIFALVAMRARKYEQRRKEVEAQLKVANEGKVVTS